MRRKDLEQQALRNQVNALEIQLQEKEQEAMSLKSELTKYMQKNSELAKVGFSADVTSKPSVKQVQAALKNAGYDPGAIDGKIGKKTREAIRAFQKENGLAVDGKVGKLTWGLLKNYLESKAN
jgi:peptidoglycan hydrolase-like protein with peptidoglycan-binding domain